MKTKKIYLGYRGVPLTYCGVEKLTLKKPIEWRVAVAKATKGDFVPEDFEEDLEAFFKQHKSYAFAFFVRKKYAREWAEEFAYV